MIEEEWDEEELDDFAKGLVSALGLKWEYGVEVLTGYGKVYIPYLSETIAKTSMKEYEESGNPKLVRRLVTEWSDAG